MRKIIDKALEIVQDDGGLDCLKDALREAVRIVNPSFNIRPEDWDYMMTELMLILAGKEYLL